MRLELSKRISAILLLVGIILLVLAPIFGTSLDTVLIEEKNGEELKDDSLTELKEAYSSEVTIGKNEKIIIEFSANFENCSINLIIVGKGHYESIDEKDSPTLLTDNKDFLVSKFAMGDVKNDNPEASEANLADITNDGYYYIEFMGSIDGTDLISEPGDYVIVVYGQNLGVKDDEVEFNIKIMTDGPADAGDILEVLFLIIGIGLIGFVALISFINLINKWRRLE